MKLKMSLPEHPGWIFAVPGFDFVALLLALVMLTGVVAKEGLVEVKLPPATGLRTERMSDVNPVIVTVQSSSDGPTYYVGRRQVSHEELEEEISTASEERETRAVAIEADQGVSVKDYQELQELVAGLDLRIYLVVRNEAQFLEDEE